MKEKVYKSKKYEDMTDDERVEMFMSWTQEERDQEMLRCIDDIDARLRKIDSNTSYVNFVFASAIALGVIFIISIILTLLKLNFSG